MKTSNYTVRILEPENIDGYLTQNKEVNVENRILSKKVFLAVNDSPDNWKEITKAEGEAIEAEIEAKRIARDKELSNK